ncbi:MAG TPA: DUF6285 domain-containing protein [Xanthobacteraceae bacterium]|nr:DUF6285 domain-containing protein [Xanthobacteraceae bacterium]
MKQHPAATELLASASNFLRDELLPSLRGAHAFNLRICINAIDLVRREIEQGADAIERERSRLVELLGRDTGLDAMRNELCRRISSGELTLDQPALREHLRATTMERLAVDQPNYSAYLAAVARRGGTDQNEPSEE